MKFENLDPNKLPPEIRAMLLDGISQMIGASPDLIPFMLDDQNNVVQARSYAEWMAWSSNHRETLEECQIGPSRVRTVFLAHNHGNCINMPNEKIFFMTRVSGPFRTTLYYEDHSSAMIGHSMKVAEITKKTNWTTPIAWQLWAPVRWLRIPRLARKIKKFFRGPEAINIVKAKQITMPQSIAWGCNKEGG